MSDFTKDDLQALTSVYMRGQATNIATTRLSEHNLVKEGEDGVLALTEAGHARRATLARKLTPRSK